jgi:DNA processing protein
MQASDAWLRLALVPGLGPRTAEQLLAEVAHPAEVFSFSPSQLQRLDGIGPAKARAISDPHGDELVQAERAAAAAAGVQIVTRDDADYPRALRLLPDPPLALWIRGTLEARDQIALSVVGPRRPTAAGHRHTRRFCQGFARSGITVVSGLARGIDTVAHEAALAAAGRTVAVIGSGIAKLYPQENSDLADHICDGHGCLISELPMHTPPSPGAFPRRNRLVAALGLGTLVIEAGQRSGSLITARLSGELGRTVCVLPGPIDAPEHVGSNKLLRDGATLVTDWPEVCEEIEALRMMAEATPEAEQKDPRVERLNGRERQVYQLLGSHPQLVDDLVRTSGLASSVISTTLLSLELRRLVKKEPGGYVQNV